MSHKTLNVLAPTINTAAKLYTDNLIIRMTNLELSEEASRCRSSVQGPRLHLQVVVVVVVVVV